MTLRQYICDGKKKPVRGAISRLAEFLDVPFSRAQRLAFGAVEPDAATALRMQDFVSSRVSIFANQTGPKAKYAKNLPIAKR